MIKLKSQYKYVIGSVAFVLYAFFAARPVPQETVFTLKWLKSLGSSYPSSVEGSSFVPFNFCGYFGYVSPDGDFIINQVKKTYVEQSGEFFAEFSGQDESIEVKNLLNNTVLVLKDKHGYPFFRDGRIFIMHHEQNSISEIDENDNILWSYDCGSPITSVDAARGLLLIGQLDGSLELLDAEGRRVYLAEPSGSRIPAIYGCTISPSGTKIAAVAGLDHQRFLVIELDGGVWRVTHHEFLGDGFRRPVHVHFIDNEKRAVFERDEGLGIYDLGSRSTEIIPLDGRIRNIDDSGENGMLFLIVSESAMRNNLVAISYPGYKMISAPFNSTDTFLKWHGKRLFVGGGNKLAAFQIEKM
ncbi:MAG: WD40 repeat domain-containing protein [Spirochaetaceae bacterium]|nr:WD40 repeat domain-containing protein [Spirochaetaceae bacterium]